MSKRIEALSTNSTTVPSGTKIAYIVHDSMLEDEIIEKIEEYLRYEDGSILRRKPTVDRFRTWLKKGRV